jgi:hypothetical protein
MSIVVNANLRNVNAANNNFMEIKVPLTFSGNYPTGGDTLDLTPITKDLPTQEVIGAFAFSNSSVNTALGQAGGFYVCQGQPGPVGGVNNVNAVATTAFNVWKLKVFKNTAGSIAEYANGAYGADVTSDYVILRLVVRKLGAL